MTTTSPWGLAARYRAELLEQLGHARDGEVEAVHEARVITRRMREILPLASPDEAGRCAMRELGRALGTVRELDVMGEVLATFEHRVPATAAAAAVARAALRCAQRRERREMVKQLDQVKLRELRLPDPPRLLDPARRRWRSALRERIGAQAGSVETQLQRASAVYFPGRAHRVRVGVKKLRYAVEAAEMTGLWRPPNVLKDLKRIQSTLGNIHDMQVTRDRLQDLVQDQISQTQAALLADTLDAAIDEQYARFAANRGRLRAIVDVCQRAVGQPRSRPTLADAASRILLLPLGRTQQPLRAAMNDAERMRRTTRSSVLPASPRD